MRTLWPWALALALCAGHSFGKNETAGDDLFLAGTVPRLRIEVPPEGMETLREYLQVWRQKRPERVDVRATIRDGDKVFTNVALHLKGSFSFQPIDRKPSMTLNFDKLADGQRFHGLMKIHLNNSVQDPSYLCEPFARELFNDLGVTSPRAGHALVSLNGRDLGLYVVIEGANKQFVKRHFKSAKGNLYDGGSGGDVSSALETDSGENPNDRSDLTNLVKAAKEPDPAKRLARLEQVLDVERFITFAATEAFLVHWDGYAFNGNNYRVFHDVARDKMIFMPHGLDQLFGTSSSLSFNVTPVFKGVIAKALFSVPEARQRYLRRLGELSTNELRAEALHARVDKLAAQLRPALAKNPQIRSQLDEEVSDLKTRITRRAASVAQQLKTPRRPLQIVDGASVRLPNWTFKPGITLPASSGRSVVDNRQILRVIGRGPASSGAWRTTAFLDEGRYEFTGLARTEGTVADSTSTNGVILRVSGERSIKGITISEEWKKLTYQFDVRGIEDVELVCEFRGTGAGLFDPATMQMTRIGPASNQPLTRFGAE
jgi:hypothetical protein